jgi:hypothetical protein
MRTTIELPPAGPRDDRILMGYQYQSDTDSHFGCRFRCPSTEETQS